MQKDLMTAVSLLSEKELMMLTCSSVSDTIKEVSSKNAEHSYILTSFYSSWGNVERNIERTIRDGKEVEDTDAAQKAVTDLCELLKEQIKDLQQEIQKAQALSSPDALLLAYQATDTGKSLQRAWVSLLNEDMNALVKMVAYAENDLSIDAMKLFRSIVQASGVKVITSGSAERCPDGERDGEMIFVCDRTGLKLSYHQPRGRESKPVYTIASVKGNLIEDRYIGTRFQQTSCDDQSVEAVKAISSQIVKTIRDHYVPEDTRQTVDSKFVFVNLDDLQPAAFEPYQVTRCNLGDTIVVLNSAPGKRIFGHHRFVPDEKAVSPVIILSSNGKYEGQPEDTDVVNTYRPNQRGRMSIYIQEIEIDSMQDLPIKVVNLEVS